MKHAAIALVSLFAVAAQSIPTGVAGDPAAGKALFEAAGECLTCHTIESRGSRRGRDLSWISMLRSPESLRRSLLDSDAHTSKFPAAQIDHLVAYLRTLRSIPPSEPRERTRSIAPASENIAFFNRPERAAEEKSDALVKSLEIREGSRIADI